MKFAIAASGEDAISFCCDTPYDLILMEVRMPGIGGMEATRQIRAQGGKMATIPIFAVTARVSDVDIAAYTKAGMSGILKKPINEINLLGILEKELGLHFDAASSTPPDDDMIYAVLEGDELSLLNWETFREYSALLKKDFIPILRKYLSISPDAIGEIGEAIVNGDAAKVEELAHQLKSTSLIFGAEDLSNIAARLEIMGREKKLKGANQFYKEMHMIFERVQPVLKKKLVLLKSMN